MREAHETDAVADRRPADASVPGVATAGPGDHPALSAERVLALQRTIGNTAVGELLRRTGLRPGRGGVRRLARKLSDAQLATTDASAIMADETYIESNLVSFDFYGAELAVLHYKDGGTLRLGLVPEWITPPVEGVDYRSTSHTRMPADPGKLRFVAGGQSTLMQAPDAMSFGEAVNRLSSTVTFTLDATSGRIVPSQVNSITAPRLCAALRGAEADYVRDFNAFAAGGTKVTKKAELIVILASLLPAGPEAAAGRGAAAATAAAGARAESKLLTLIKTLIKGSAKPAELAVEGVDLGGIEAAVQGERLWVRYSSIINTGRTAGYGRMVQSALERAAIAAAKEAGAKTVEVGVTTIINASWKAYLESLGYVPELVATGANTWTKVWTRVFTL